MKKYTMQSMFNKVAKHLLTQGERAVEKGIFGKVCTCYDKETGNRCAFGCLLPLEWYRKNGDVDTYTVMNMVNVERYTDEHEMMLDLQACHDGVKPSRWPQRLRAIARKYNVEIPPFLVDA